MSIPSLILFNLILIRKILKNELKKCYALIMKMFIVNDIDTTLRNPKPNQNLKIVRKRLQKKRKRKTKIKLNSKKKKCL